MALIDELAEQLARDAFRAAEDLGDESVIEEVARILGTSSPTIEEVYRTAIRYLVAEARARRALEARLEAAGRHRPPPGRGD